MKFNICGESTFSDEIFLNLTDVFRRIILRSLEDMSLDEQIAFIKKGVERVREQSLVSLNFLSEDRTKEDKITHLLYLIERYETNYYLNTVLAASRRQGLHIAGILVSLFSRNTQLHPFGEIHLVEKEDMSFIISEFHKAFDSGILPKTKHIRMVDALLGKEKEPEVNPLYSFFQEMSKSSNNDNFMYFEDDDYYLEAVHYYIKNVGIDYKKILYSTSFKEYIEEHEIENDEFECLPSLISEYMEKTSKLSFQTLILNEIRKDKEKYHRHILNRFLVENIMFGDGDDTLFTDNEA